MKEREILPLLLKRLREEPAVVLFGPRQAGKTTLALRLQELLGGTYLDLEAPSDLGKLTDAELYLSSQLHTLVILDEVHRTPDLFPVLRGLIDKARRMKKAEGRYLLLGSASFELLRQAGESLAGRVSYMELSPFSLGEGMSGPEDLGSLWLRGGFPESFLSPSESRSLQWRRDFAATYLERDLPRFGAALPPETLRRLWTMLAYSQGGLFNAVQFSKALGIDVRTVNRYIDLFTGLLLIRRLLPWHDNGGKRLVKSPKLYVRDSGVLHSLLGLGTTDEVLSHPVAGLSWEGFIVENIINSLKNMGANFESYFYRTAAGAEMDLLVCLPGGNRYAFEVKRALNPAPGKGFWNAHEDLKPAWSYVVYPGKDTYPIARDVSALSVYDLTETLKVIIKEQQRK
jgi:uncharacterized protein